LAEFVGFDRQLSRQLAAAEDLQTIKASVNEPFLAQELLRHLGAIFELLERTQIHNRVRGPERRVVESTFWQPPDKWHLTTFEPEPDAPPRTSFLSLMTFTAGFSVTGTFAASEAFHPMLRSRAGF
jgi:hypothetical protein